MSTTYEDPVVAEKQVAAEEDGSSASDLSLANGVARDYELKCALSESLVCALPHYSRFIRYLVNKCLQEECVSFSATDDDIIDPADRIGFGRYQWQLFILSGLGWLADSKSCLHTPGTRVLI